MSEVAASTSPPVHPAAAEEGAGGNAPEEEDGAPNPREVRCSDCIVWNRQQTWLCVVPLLIGFIGLGLSLMLLKWIVVGTVKDYVPPDLMDSKGIGQDPIFLSKPSSFPKSMETTTTTTTTRTPNQISTRLTTTTRAPTRIPGSRVPMWVNPRTTTMRHTLAPPTILSTTVPLSTTTFASRPFPGTPNTQQMPIWPTSDYSTSSYKIFLHVSTQSWTQSRFHESTTTTPEPTPMPKHHTTTYFTERSEHFKSCKDKDLAYCLNDGECFVIETLTASHKHCRCKEGYQGVRCDQFLPKTDSVLSDPTDHLGIEFMESKEVYQQQILSISCIVFGIVAVGLICAAFYCRTKKQTKNIQEQLKETQNGKNYNLHASSFLPKSHGESRIQMHSYSKPEQNHKPARENIMESSFSDPQQFSESTSPDRGRNHRNIATCFSPSQRNRMLQRNGFRRTPPLPSGRLSGNTGQAYQQLEETGLVDQETMTCQECSVCDLTQPQKNSRIMQLYLKDTQSYFNKITLKDSVSFSTSRASSIPIIPSVGLNDACMQIQNSADIPCFKVCKISYSTELGDVNILPRSSHLTQHNEVKILLETVQEQIQIMNDTRRKSEDLQMANTETEEKASENTAFLPLSPKAKNEQDAQYLLRKEMHKDLTLL